MFLTESKMIKNSLNVAKKKLEIHYQMGMDSDLSIFEVANLRDLILQGDSPKEQKTKSIFFSFSAN